MRRWVVAAGAGVVVGVVVIAARVSAGRIRRGADRVPLERLRREPPGTDQVVQRPDGTRLRVRVAGPEDAPTVVLAHGIALELREWNLVWESLLAEGFRVIGFDHRGHGGSTPGSDGIAAAPMARDYGAVLEATGTTHAVLVGHSMGGFLALRAVLDVPVVPERLAGMVLVSAFARDVLEGAPQNLAEAPALGTGLLGAVGRNTTAGTLLAASFFGPHPSPAMLQALLEMVLAHDRAPLRGLVPELLSGGLLDRLEQVHVPTVVVCGTRDRTTPPADSAELAAGIPGARMVWVEDAGHMLPWEAPETIVATIVDVAHR